MHTCPSTAFWKKRDFSQKSHASRCGSTESGCEISVPWCLILADRERWPVCEVEIETLVTRVNWTRRWHDAGPPPKDAGPATRQLKLIVPWIQPTSNTAHINASVSRVGITLVHHLQMLAQRCTNDCGEDKTIPAIMPPVLDRPCPANILKQNDSRTWFWQWLFWALIGHFRFYSGVHCLKVIYHPLYGMNNYVFIWGDWLSWEGHMIANHPI